MAYSKLFLKIRHVILFIYNYECQLCNYVGFELEVHHFDKNSKNDDVFNLVPYCKDCHQLAHGKILLQKPVLDPGKENALLKLDFFIHK